MICFPAKNWDDIEKISSFYRTTSCCSFRSYWRQEQKSKYVTQNPRNLQDHRATTSINSLQQKNNNNNNNGHAAKMVTGAFGNKVQILQEKKAESWWKQNLEIILIFIYNQQQPEVCKLHLQFSSGKLLDRTLDVVLSSKKKSNNHLNYYLAFRTQIIPACTLQKSQIYSRENQLEEAADEAKKSGKLKFTDN